MPKAQFGENTPLDRKARVENMGPPRPKTPTYDAIRKAFEEADKHQQEHDVVDRALNEDSREQALQSLEHRRAQERTTVAGTNFQQYMGALRASLGDFPKISTPSTSDSSGSATATPGDYPSQGSDTSESTTLAQLEHLPSPPTTVPDITISTPGDHPSSSTLMPARRAMLMNLMLRDMGDKMTSPEKDEHSMNIISQLRAARLKPEATAHIERTLNSDTSLEPVKNLWDIAKFEHVNDMFKGIKHTVDASRPSRVSAEEAFAIGKDMATLRRDDPEGYDRLKSKIVERAEKRNSLWVPIKIVGDLVERDDTVLTPSGNAIV